MKIPVVVSTCDKYLWALRPFAYLFNVYWSELQPVYIAGYKPPDFELPSNFRFISIRSQEYRAQKWSTGMIEFFDIVELDLFVWLLDDYWLTRTVDTKGVETLADYVRTHPNTLRMDLTTDRLYNGQMTEADTFGHYDIVETPYKSPYQMSLQAGIWRASLLLDVLVRDRSPWEVEIKTQPPDTMRVFGTRQWPVRYLNAFKGNNPNKVLNLEQLASEHLENVLTMLPNKVRENVEKDLA